MLARRYAGVVFDIDGVLVRGEEPIAGAAEAVETLRQRGIGTAFVTNNASRTPAQIAAVLQAAGIPATADTVVTSALAAAELLDRRLKRPPDVEAAWEAPILAFVPPSAPEAIRSGTVVVNGWRVVVPYAPYAGWRGSGRQWNTIDGQLVGRGHQVGHGEPDLGPVRPGPSEHGVSHDVLPLYLYEGERVFLHASRVGLKLSEDRGRRFDVFFDYRFEGFPQNRLPAELAGLSEREPTVDAGLAYRRRTAWGNFSVELFKDAIQTYEQLLEINPSNINVMQHLTQLYIHQHQLQEALSLLQKIRKMGYGGLETGRKIGLIYMEMERYDDAVKEFTEILGQEPNAHQIIAQAPARNTESTEFKIRICARVAVPVFASAVPRMFQTGVPL